MIEGWKNLNFPDFVILQRGRDLVKSKFSNGRVPVASSTGIMGYHNESFVKSPGVTVGRSGSCGKISFYHVDFWAHNTTLYVKNFHGNDELFTFYYLQFIDLGKFKTGASVPTLDRNSLNTFVVSIPTLHEQRKIAHILNTLQKAIAQQDKLIKTTTEIKKALMQKVFTEGTRGEKQKETEIGLVPESWVEISIGDLGKCVTGTTPKTALEKYWNSLDFDFVAPADIGNTRYVYNSAKMMSERGLLVSRVLPKNSVMCVCIGSSIGKLGLTYKERSATNQQINSIICNEDYHSIYTYYLLTHYAEHWRSHATFGPVPILNKGQFELVKIYTSTDKIEQLFIADSLQTLDNKIESQQKKKQALSDLFKTILHELMTGQRRVHEIEFEALTKAYKIEEQPLSIAAET